MSRRFDVRLRCALPIILSSDNGNNTTEGTILDISATHFRAQFPTALSGHKRFKFALLFPDHKEVRGSTKIERAYPRHADGKHTYVFLIENLPSGHEKILIRGIEQENESNVCERRSSNDGFDKKNRRASDRDTPRLNRSRVVITGIGVVSANAIGRAAFWDAIQQHQSGIREITMFDTNQFPVKIGAEVNNEVFLDLIPRRKASHMGRATKFGWLAAKQALKDAEFNMERENRDRIGVAMGTTLGALDWAFEQYASLSLKGYQGQHPYTVAAGSSNAVSGEICVEYGLRGPSLSFSQGCSSASMAIAHGLDLIQSNKADVMLVGGADAPLNPTVFGAFVRSGMLAKLPPNWKANVISEEDFGGIVLGEGGCVLLLESYDHAIQRGAPIYAELLSSGSTSEGHHMIFADPSGRGTARAIREAITLGRIEKESIDLIVGHVAGVRQAYEIEMRALRRELGTRLGVIPVSNVKPLIGYTQGACGAFEVAAACLAFQDPVNWITYGRSYPSMKASKILIDCIGFGGKNIALIIGGPPDR